MPHKWSYLSSDHVYKTFRCVECGRFISVDDDDFPDPHVMFFERDYMLSGSQKMTCEELCVLLIHGS
jgi:hypothetical protein